MPKIRIINLQMEKPKKIKVGITIGDPNGIGVELILKTFEDKNIFKYFIPIVFGNTKLLLQQKKHFNLKTEIKRIKEIKNFHDFNLNVFNCWDEEFEINYGYINNKAGELSAKSILFASEALKKNKIDTLVTLPINKSAIQSEIFKFKGHTDFFSKKFSGETLMFMINDKLKLALVTDHIPVSSISKTLTNSLLNKKIELLIESLKKDFLIKKPKIAVLGCDPHCGDNGVIGNKDQKVIVPVIKRNFDKGTLIYGPFSSDGFFGNKEYKRFDAIISIYHDQGLVPFKLLSFGEGVNFTAGLDYVRTSPDHGTAFDIAGKGLAKINSFKEALFKSREIYLNRNKKLNK